MIGIIFTVIMLFMWVALLASYGFGAEQNGEYTLGITLPKAERKSAEVEKVLQEYRKGKRLIHLIGFASIWLNLLIQDYTSILIVYIFVWFCGLLFAYTKVLKKYAWKLYNWKKENGKLMLTETQKEAGVEDDGDIYWLQGKKNPDLTLMQEKRVGFGMEINANNKVNIFVFVFVGLFILGLSIFMLRFDLAEVTMETKDGVITIEAADMESIVPVDQIEEVIYMEDCPSMHKKHGYNGGKFNLGTFNVDRIGTCEVYVYVHNDAGILITTKDEKVMFNLETEKETKEAFETLKQLVPVSR